MKYINIMDKTTNKVFEQFEIAENKTEIEVKEYLTKIDNIIDKERFYVEIQEEPKEEKFKSVETYAKTTRWVFTGWTPREVAEKHIKNAQKVVTRKEYTVCYYENGDIERYKM